MFSSKLYKAAYVLSALIFYCSFSSAQRTVTNINKGWQFTKSQYQPGTDTSLIKWEHINLPHTWNKDDVMDDVPGYYRGACWYRYTLKPNRNYQNKQVFLYFNGANQQTWVYVNGQLAGAHTGGYTHFCVPISAYLKTNVANEIAVKVDNSFNEDIAPLTADFTFYGGIYRDVNLIVTSKTHFDLANAANGVFISTPAVSAKNASIKISGQIINSSGGSVQIVTSVLDRTGKQVAVAKNNITGSAFTQNIPHVVKPHLWSVNDPYLYKVITRIIDTKTGTVLDQIINPLGFRWFRFDAEKGFFINDKAVKLIGTSRHQDFEGLGNALPDSYHVRDIELLKQMGGNFLRVAHYPQDPQILATCDRLGIVASVEIPIVNTITESEAFAQNCKNMQVEMIRQNFNHPSVIIWAYMNEVLLRPKYGEDKNRQHQYFANIKKLADELETLTRKEDPSRYTMMSCHGDYNKYTQTGLIQTAMIAGWNLYNGWYGGKISDFGSFLDKYHQQFPHQPVIITEFGADADPRIHASEPERFDKSIEYTIGFHQVYLKAIQQRPFIAGGAIWNLADFNSESRDETMPHINNKGLLSWNRKPKDVYRFYQANLLKSPYLQISDWVNLASIADSLNDNISTQPLTIFSNAQKINLKINGTDLGTKPVTDGMATWQVPLKNGTNQVEASSHLNGKALRVVKIINQHIVPRHLQLAKAISINAILGTRRFYTDSMGRTWIPAPQYRKGSFGYVGGNVYSVKNGRQSYGTDRNILKSNDDPVFQTQQENIQAFCFDVPAGKYQLILYFAELTPDKTKEALAYNLDNGANAQQATEERVFDVIVNGKKMLSNFNPAKKYGVLTAGSESLPVNVTGNAGIVIEFKPIDGKPVLNAIALKNE